MRRLLFVLALTACDPVAATLDAGAGDAGSYDPRAFVCVDGVPTCPRGSAPGCVLSDSTVRWRELAGVCQPGERAGTCEGDVPTCPGDSWPRCVWPGDGCGEGCTGSGLEGCSR